MSNVNINVDRQTDGRKIGCLYRTLLQAGAIKSKGCSTIGQLQNELFIPVFPTGIPGRKNCLLNLNNESPEESTRENIEEVTLQLPAEEIQSPPSPPNWTNLVFVQTDDCQNSDSRKQGFR